MKLTVKRKFNWPEAKKTKTEEDMFLEDQVNISYRFLTNMFTYGVCVFAWGWLWGSVIYFGSLVLMVIAAAIYSAFRCIKL